MGAFLIILILFFALWPLVSRFLGRLIRWWISRKLRKAMGLDQEFFKGGPKYSSRHRSSGHKGDKEAASPEPIIPKEYAVDVEFVEVKEFAQTEVAVDKDGNSKIRQEVKIESQVTDVEWEEVK